MQSTVHRLLMGLGMFVLALLATGVLASALEQRALELRPVDESYVPPEIPRI